ncbi:MAG: hypothetical protein Q4D02_03275 [Clostridia bacterium]|nr:hypothetical protein [Clostridia bacterium]
MIEKLINNVETFQGTEVDVSVGNIFQFIGKDTEVKPSPFFPGTYFDNYNLYEEVISVSNIEQLGSVITSTFKWMLEHFGLVTSESSANRQRILMRGRKHEDGIIRGVSVNDLLGKSAALCSERATFIHNILILAGFQATLIFGSINGEPHAFNLIRWNNKQALLDISNYHLVKKGDREFVEPTLCFLNDEEYQKILRGGSYTTKKDQLFTIGELTGNVKYTYGGNRFMN